MLRAEHARKAVPRDGLQRIRVAQSVRHRIVELAPPGVVLRQGALNRSNGLIEVRRDVIAVFGEERRITKVVNECRGTEPRILHSRLPSVRATCVSDITPSPLWRAPGKAGFIQENQSAWGCLRAPLFCPRAPKEVLDRVVP